MCSIIYVPIPFAIASVWWPGGWLRTAVGALSRIIIYAHFKCDKKKNNKNSNIIIHLAWKRQWLAVNQTTEASTLKWKLRYALYTSIGTLLFGSSISGQLISSGICEMFYLFPSKFFTMTTACLPAAAIAFTNHYIQVSSPLRVLNLFFSNDSRRFNRIMKSIFYRPVAKEPSWMVGVFKIK